MRRTGFIKLCLLLTMATCGAAVAIRLSRAASEPLKGDMFALIGPVFLVMTASKAHRFPRASVVMAVLGLALGGLALVGVLR